MTNNILLTIAIPTYNGADSIVKTLKSVLQELMDGVEVLISDNNSTDDTAVLVREVAGSDSRVRYFCNGTNVGFDRNVDLCMQRATGNFVWLLADDDVMCRRGAVSCVLDVIRANPDAAVIFADYRHPIKLCPEHTGLCCDASDFLKKSRFKSGLISSNIFRRNIWLKSDVSRYFDSGWIHMGFLVGTIMSLPSYVICTELVAQLIREEGRGIMRWGGTGSFLRTGLNLVRIYRGMPELGYDPATVRSAYLTIKGGYLKNIPLAKAKGLRVDAALVKDFVELYKHFPSFWLVDLPLLLLPGFIFRSMRSVVHLLSRREAR